MPTYYTQLCTSLAEPIHLLFREISPIAVVLVIVGKDLVKLTYYWIWGQSASFCHFKSSWFMKKKTPRHLIKEKIPQITPPSLCKRIHN